MKSIAALAGVLIASIWWMYVSRKIDKQIKEEEEREKRYEADVN